MKQEDDLRGKFLQKGYKRDHIQEQVQLVRNMDRRELVQDRNKLDEEKYEITLVLDFNAQYGEFEMIVKKHWSILKSDPHLGEIKSDCFPYL